MENRSLVTIANHSKERILYLLEMAREFEKKPNRHLLDEKLLQLFSLNLPRVLV